MWGRLIGSTSHAKKTRRYETLSFDPQIQSLIFSLAQGRKLEAWNKDTDGKLDMGANAGAIGTIERLGCVCVFVGEGHFQICRDEPPGCERERAAASLREPRANSTFALREPTLSRYRRVGDRRELCTSYVCCEI
jgi:hypothetical protein